MVEIEISGYGKLNIQHIVLDFNGTIAISGKLINGVTKILNELSKKVNIHVFTADTFGNVEKELSDVICRVSVVPKNHEDYGKLDCLEKLGSKSVIAIGNGMNDRLMLDKAAIGICVVGNEGAATKTLLVSDIVVTNIFDAFALILDTNKLKTTLRS